MKKQTVLSLSVIVLVMSSDLFAPVGKPATRRSPMPTRITQQDESKSESKVVSPSVPSDDAQTFVANNDVSMADIAEVATELAGSQVATEAGKQAARKYITGQPASSGSSANKGQRLGRLGK